LTKASQSLFPISRILVNKKYNTSLKQYIIDRKLNIAKKMLNKTDMSITQIANSLGYNDPLAFSKLFTLNIGVSPRKYKTNSIEKK
jgi:AraC family transcriptional regulator of arabinose operon